MSGKLPEVLRDNELLGRGVFSSKQARKRSPPFNVFLEQIGKSEISVNRMVDSDERMFALGHQLANIRGGNRTFYGWAVLSVKDARQNERIAHASPQSDNPYHADICLPRRLRR